MHNEELKLTSRPTATPSLVLNSPSGSSVIEAASKMSRVRSILEWTRIIRQSRLSHVNPDRSARLRCLGHNVRSRQRSANAKRVSPLAAYCVLDKSVSPKCRCRYCCIPCTGCSVLVLKRMMRVDWVWWSIPRQSSETLRARTCHTSDGTPVQRERL